MEKLPLHPSLQTMPIEQALNFATQGDDYELLFSANVSKRTALKELSLELDLNLSCIGRLSNGSSHQYTLNNKTYTTEAKGYSHF
jgi:thiamine monophosphate kinase